MFIKLEVEIKEQGQMQSGKHLVSLHILETKRNLAYFTATTLEKAKEAAQAWADKHAIP